MAAAPSEAATPHPENNWQDAVYLVTGFSMIKIKQKAERLWRLQRSGSESPGLKENARVAR